MENNENEKKMKPFQLKYSVNNNKFPLSTKSMSQKLSLRNNAFKPVNRRTESNENYFQLKSSIGQRNSMQDIKKYSKGDGFDMLARGTDGFKKYEPIGKTLQSHLGRKGTAGNPHLYSQQQNRPNVQYNNFGVYTSGMKLSGQKFQRANSSNQGFKSQNNFMKTTTDGFGQAYNKKALTQIQQIKRQSNLQSLNKITGSNEDLSENNDNNNISNKNKNNDAKNQENSIPQNTTQATQPSSTNGFNFKKPNSNDSKKRQNLPQKKLNEAMNKANLYNDDVVKRQFAFEKQEKEEELQFIELCGLLNNLITEQ